MKRPANSLPPCTGTVAKGGRERRGIGWRVCLCVRCAVLRYVAVSRAGLDSNTAAAAIARAAAENA